MQIPKNLLAACRKDLIDIYKHSIDSVKPERLLHGSLELKHDELVIIDVDKSQHRNVRRYDLEESRIHVIGGGKCVFDLAQTLANLAETSQMTHRFSHGALSLPIGIKASMSTDAERKLAAIGVKCLYGSKDNLPDGGSVEATELILDSISQACLQDERDNLQSLFLVLISGGGSACLCSPKILSLSEKLDLIKRLVQKGADIVDLNSVRRCFSKVKAGQLASNIIERRPNSKIVSLILSDVVGDPVEYIASGPTFLAFKDEDHVAKMVEVLHKYGVELQQNVLEQLSKTKPQSCMSPIGCDTIFNKLIGNNKIALGEASRRAAELGYGVYLLNESLQGSTSDALEKFMSFIHNCGFQPSQRNIFIAGGETIVEKLDNESWGSGGRLQEFCLDYMISKLGNATTLCAAPNNSVVDFLLAGSTDGQDGPTDVAACLASGAENNTLEMNSKIWLDECRSAKRRHDSYTFWSSRKPDWLVKTGLTGTNVMDLYLYLNVPNPLLTRVSS